MQKHYQKPNRHEKRKHHGTPGHAGSDCEVEDGKGRKLRPATRKKKTHEQMRQDMYHQQVEKGVLIPGPKARYDPARLQEQAKCSHELKELSGEVIKPVVMPDVEMWFEISDMLHNRGGRRG